MAGNIDSITPQIPNESLYDEKCSFLALACMDYATDPIRYDDFIGVYDFYIYIKDNPEKFQTNIDAMIHNKDIELIYKFFKDDYQKRKHPIRKIHCFVKERFRSSPDEQHEPKLMNIFHLHLLSKVIPDVDHVNGLRINKGRLYVENLSNNSDFIIPHDKRAPYLRYPVFYVKPKLTKKLLNNLRSENFEVGNYNWARTLGQFLKLKEKFENSEYISKNMINLPCYPSLKDEEILKITEIINKCID
jgi:hypothetical protein